MSWKNCQKSVERVEQWTKGYTRERDWGGSRLLATKRIHLSHTVIKIFPPAEAVLEMKSGRQLTDKHTKA